MNSRQKGKRGENELARVLREYGYDSHRGVQYKGGQDSPDVVGLPLIHIECKRVEQLNIYEAYEQSKRDAGILIPVVMHRKNDYSWLVTMAEEDFWDMHDLGRMPMYVYEVARKRLDLYGLLFTCKIEAKKRGVKYYALCHSKEDSDESNVLITMPLPFWMLMYREWELEQNVPKEERS